jgi:hypothetical protein
VKEIKSVRAAQSHETLRSGEFNNIEAEIDQLVYRLYGLTEEEIGIVEGS